MASLGQLIRITERKLSRAGIGDARIEADLIWMTALEVDRAELYASYATEPPNLQALKAHELMERRLRHEPAAYLMGHREFYGIDLVVGPGALIPRPDTETLVEEALRIAAGMRADLTIADVGTGTGAIAIALATHLPQARVIAIDISQRALEIARENVSRQGLTDRVTLREGDVLDALDGPVDLITANLPYVMSSELPTLDPEIRMYEPPEALDGGEDGLDLVRRLLTELPAHLNANGVALLEMDPRQIERASVHARELVREATIRSVDDLTKRPRVLVVET